MTRVPEAMNRPVIMSPAPLPKKAHAEILMCRKTAGIVEKLAVKDGWEIVGKDKHPIGTTDYSSSLSDCKKSGAQVLFMWAYSPEISILLKQWADMEVPVGFIGAAEDPGFWKRPLLLMKPSIRTVYLIEQ